MKFVFMMLFLLSINLFAFDCIKKDTKTQDEVICCKKAKDHKTDFRIRSEAGWKRALDRGEITKDFYDCAKSYYASLKGNSNSIGESL